MHVLLHCIFRHPFVNTLLDHDLWDLACDIAVENIISSMRPQVKSLGLTDTREVCWKFFIDKVRRNLKVGGPGAWRVLGGLLGWVFTRGGVGGCSASHRK